MKTLVDYAKSFIGKPYIWGGEGPIGFDCSGLVQEILRSVGDDPPGDQTAQGLYNHFKENGTISECMAPGVIAFYGKTLIEITHVAFGIDSFRVIEAGGGDRRCTNEFEASKIGAMVRIRPYRSRKDFLGMLMPEYANCERY